VIGSGSTLTKHRFPDCHARSPGRLLGLPTYRLRITPPSGSGLANQRRDNRRFALPGNPDIVIRNSWPAIPTPPAIVTVRPPMSLTPSVIPLMSATGRWRDADSPQVSARTPAVPCQHDTRRRPRVWLGANNRPRPVGVPGDSARLARGPPAKDSPRERAFSGLPVTQWAPAPAPNNGFNQSLFLPPWAVLIARLLRLADALGGPASGLIVEGETRGLAREEQRCVAYTAESRQYLSKPLTGPRRGTTANPLGNAKLGGDVDPRGCTTCPPCLISNGAPLSPLVSRAIVT